MYPSACDLDRRMLLNTVVKWRCLDLHRSWTISKIDFLKFYLCLYKIKIFLIPIKVPQGAKSLQWLYNSKIHNNKLYKETIQTIMHCSKYNASIDMHCRRWLFLDRHLINRSTFLLLLTLSDIHIPLFTNSSFKLKKVQLNKYWVFVNCEQKKSVTPSF